MEATFDPDSNPYKETGETYGEYIARLEKIIYRWHERYTTLSYKLIEQIKAWPEKIPAWNPTENYTGYYVTSDIDKWFEELKEIV